MTFSGHNGGCIRTMQLLLFALFFSQMPKCDCSEYLASLKDQYCSYIGENQLNSTFLYSLWGHGCDLSQYLLFWWWRSFYCSLLSERNYVHPSSSLVFKTFSTKEITFIMKMAKDKKNSHGYNEISTELLKISATYVFTINLCQ